MTVDVCMKQRQSPACTKCYILSELKRNCWSERDEQDFFPNYWSEHVDLLVSELVRPGEDVPLLPGLAAGVE